MSHEQIVSLRSDDPRRADLERQGWTVVGESWGARLRLGTAGTPERARAEARLHGAVAAAEQRGYRVVELGADAAEAIAALDASNEPDYPSTPSTAHTAPGAEEVRGLVSTKGVRFFGALSGEELVAVSGVYRRPDRGETELTSVRADHRGLGLAYAVKAAAILALAPDGVEVFGTGGAAANAGSLAMNRGLGYVIEEHWYDLQAPAGPALTFRLARRADLQRIVELIADDAVAAARTGAFGPAHVAGFDAIEASPNDELWVAEVDGEVCATAQLTFVPGISRNGATRLLVEAVRVDATLRGQGVGRRFMHRLHERGRERGATLAQLTSDKQRPEAHRFYRNLGYAQSHEGFKLTL